jgi:hypothetical protein
MGEFGFQSYIMIFEYPIFNKNQKACRKTEKYRKGKN